MVPPATGPTTYSGIGGQVTVRVDGGALVLLGVQPTPGYTVAEQKVQPSEIEVRFENASARTRIRLRLKDGAVEAEVQE